MAETRDPAGNHYFALEIDGAEVAHFVGCSGLKAKSDVFEIEEGGVNDFVYRFATPAGYDNLVLRKASDANSAFAAWRETWRSSGTHPLKSAGVVLKDFDGLELMRMELTNVWPVRWEAPPMNSEGSALAVEELEIAFEDLRVVRTGR